MGATARISGTVLLAVLVSAVLVITLGGGLPELIFGTVMIGGLLVVIQLTVAGWSGSHREASRARRLERTSPDDLARRAVVEERRRLEADLDATIREALGRILLLVHEAQSPESMRDVQLVARAAASELRRQLGLLRTPPQLDAAMVTPSTPVGGTDDHPSRREAIIAAAAAAVAVLEASTYSYLEDYPTSSVPVTGVLTGVAAATLLWRGTAPARAALLCASVFAVGSLSGTPVTEGLWFAGAVGALLWTVVARCPLLGVGGLAAVALVASTLVTRWMHTPENLFVVVLVEIVALLGGLTVRLLGHRQSRAEVRAGLRAAELQDAVDLAVGAERASMARELHDVVSHAVGLVAVQAAAAEVSWHSDEDAARRALDLVRTTAEETLGEVSRLLPGGATSTKTVADLEALVARIRAAGTSVELRVTGEPAATDLRVAYRVVQESLTNVVRHAPGAAAFVRVDAGPGWTEVTVSDDGPGAARTVSRGYGLVGLSERIQLAGGSLSTGPGVDGHGFQVSATLPAASAAPGEPARPPGPRPEAVAP